VSGDVVVIGAGLAGLTAAVELANAGRCVRVLERRAVAGGRCGQFVHADRRFTVGCNDFGRRIIADLQELGAPVAFVPSTVDIHLGDARIGNATTLGTIGFALRHAPGLVHLMQSMRARRAPTVGALIEQHVRDPAIAGLVGLIAYAIGTPLHRWRTDDLAADFAKANAYGHDRTVVPVDGVQAIVDALLRRLHAQGGEVHTDVGGAAIDRDGEGWLVRTSGGNDVHARAVISSLPPTERATATEPAGLAAVQCLFVLGGDFDWGPVRTSIVMPGGAPDWLAELDAGQWPVDFGFHGFRDHTDADATTVTAYFLAPRGVGTFPEPMRRSMLGRIVSGLDRVRPGFEAAVRVAAMLDPDAYVQRHGLRSELASPRCDAPGPLPTRDPSTGLLRVGNGIGAPGEHANAAMLSGRRAAALLLRGEA
jgi:phytoene dehydrogenase-like protein